MSNVRPGGDPNGPQRPRFLVDAEEVARRIGMTVDYVYGLCRRGEIPHHTFGRSRRFDLDSIERWLAGRERRPGA
jgi:excisionase family DNA binding protein